MNAYDLRIGNWVHYMMHDHSLSCKLVTGIYSLRQVELSSMGQPVSLSCALAIPLTPEMLEKCGFEKKEELTGVGINDAIDVYYDGLTGISFFFDNSGCLVLNNFHYNTYRPQYLHQLQNLYYSLTGVELEIKL